MSQYKYVGKVNLDFICNGVPSHLHEGMIIKPRLIDYMLKRYPSFVKEISTPSVVNSPKASPTPKPVPVTTPPEIPPVLVNNQVISPESQLILDSDLDTSKLNAQTPIDISSLKTYENVLELYKNDLVDVCTELDLDPSGRKSELVDRVCQKLNISITR